MRRLLNHRSHTVRVALATVLIVALAGCGRTITSTPIIIANPTINAETVTPFRPGLREACSTAIPLMTPPAPPSRPT